MKAIAVGTVIRSTHSTLELPGTYRVLWTCEDTNQITLIPIPDSKKNAPIRYFPAPFTCLLSRVSSLMYESLMVESKVVLPPLVNMSDQQIRDKYPQRQTITKRKNRTDSAPLQTRDEAHKLIEPILKEIAADPAAVFGTTRLAEWIKSRAAETGKGQSYIRSALNKYLALACGENALLSCTDKCGGPNVVRSQKNGKLGRKPFGEKLGVLLEAGIALAIKDKEHLAWGWKTFLREGQSVAEAYLLTMAVFYSNGETLHQGRMIPVLKPLSQRPTLTQFRYWGPRGVDAKAAWETLLRPNEWEKRFRALYGSARDGVKAVGQIASGDSTSNDVNMISVASRLRAIGTGTVLRYHDAFSDCVVGVAFDLGKPNERLALLGIYNAAMDKVEFCKRFGIDITPDQFPSGFYRLYHYDNGELRTEASVQLLLGLGSNAEFVQAGRPDLKPIPESGHRKFHKMLDHKIAGSTRGRQRQRGEEATAISACWTYYEYMRELILAIIHHNTVASAEHLLTVEMRRDGVAPNRAAIHQWAIRKGYVARLPIDMDILRARLLPKIKAVVRSNGIFLLRPDRGNKREIVLGARFLGPRAVQLKWLQTARRTGPFDIDVNHDPDDLSQIWFVDTAGVHQLINVANDSVLLREGTFTDLLSINDDDKLRRLVEQEAFDQADANFVIDRYEQDHANRMAKRQEIKATGRKVTKTELKSGISDNRTSELKELAKDLDPLTRTPKPLPEVKVDKPHTDNTDRITETSPMDDLDAALDKFRTEATA